MTLLDVDVNDAQEPKVVPGDEEYELRILDVTIDNDKNGEPYMLPRFEVVDEPLAKDFTKFYRLPHQGLDEKQMNRAKWQIKILLETFSLPTSGSLPVEDMKGCTGWAILGVEENEQWGEQNYIKKLVKRG